MCLSATLRLMWFCGYLSPIFRVSAASVIVQNPCGPLSFDRHAAEGATALTRRASDPAFVVRGPCPYLPAVFSPQSGEAARGSRRSRYLPLPASNKFAC